ncbi:hypothetical protein OCK74_22095 [Chitinophagaceae bacterium LB-8]|uniref:DUF2231 domain-containing protein n=1 Tax=Paraflavisolibacter caeni TaxID=2982496 RepID=A0A9X3BIR5_9BACT|nr:hypothetical protein [Paraflavisolibacter caeni]MCU7551827.1 hypothetical protein [Paraflavisolibacter caeni]
MNSAQIHLALTHVPVILSLTGLVILIVSLIKKNNALVKTAYFILFIAGLAAIPVYLSGEGTEELVERLPGVSETIIERHEEIAKMAMISMAVAGLGAFIGLFLFKRSAVAKIIKGVVLLLAFSSGGLLAQTAHLGGQIRHTEIRSGSTAQNSIGNRSNQATDMSEQTKDND